MFHMSSTACFQNAEMPCFQHVDTCCPVSTLLCFDMGIPCLGFQQFKCNERVSGTGRQAVNHPSLFCVANKKIRRAFITTAVGCQVLVYRYMKLFTQ
jgi:hypothetical protein